MSVIMQLALFYLRPYNLEKIYIFGLERYII